MLYLYDRAICTDLKKSINPDSINSPVVSVISNESIIGVAAQLQNDELHFPIICVQRDPDTPIDNSRTNFTRMHRGVASVLDSKTNDLYYEKAVPIKLSYTMCIYASSQEDIDEIVRELLFKYIDMYFLTIKLPYESNRRIRFGVSIDPDAEITRGSGTSEYLQGGTLYEADIHLRCDGCMMVTYVPSKLRRIEYETEVE